MNAFARPIKGVTERRTVMNAFFISQFNYCSLIYMCCSRSLNNKIDRLHARYLQIIHCDKLLSFYELLEKDISASIHHQDIRELAIEIFIVFNGWSSEVIEEIFQFRDEEPCKLKGNSQFHVAPVDMFFNGTESIKFLKI